MSVLLCIFIVQAKHNVCCPGQFRVIVVQVYFKQDKSNAFNCILEDKDTFQLKLACSALSVWFHEA